MSAPYVIVVFKDSADGYEFPIASYLIHGSDDEIIEDARVFAMRSIESDDYRPDGELIFDRIERP